MEVNLRLIIHCYLAGSAYRECMDNGTWALKSNYSSCEPILEEKVGVQLFLLLFFCASCVRCRYKHYSDDKSEKKTLRSNDMQLMGQQLRN